MRAPHSEIPIPPNPKPFRPDPVVECLRETLRRFDNAEYDLRFGTFQSEPLPGEDAPPGARVITIRLEVGRR